jgi:hypothetical protein
MNNTKLIKFYKAIDSRIAARNMRANLYIRLSESRNTDKVRTLVEQINNTTTVLKVLFNDEKVTANNYRYYYSEFIKPNGDKIVMGSSSFEYLIDYIYSETQDLLLASDPNFFRNSFEFSKKVVKSEKGDYVLYTDQHRSPFNINTNRARSSDDDGNPVGNISNLTVDKSGFGVITVIENPFFWSSNQENNGQIEIPLDRFNAAEINWETCADENKFRVYVIRGDEVFGSFVIPEVDEKLFHRCTRTGYLLIGLANRYNERQRLPNGDYCTRYVMQNLTDTCGYCQQTYFKNEVTDEAKAAGGCNYCLERAKRLFVSAGVDAGEIKLNQNFILNPHSFRGEMQFINVENDPNPLFLGVELEVDTREDYYDDENDEDSSTDAGYSSKDHNVIAQKVVKTLSPKNAAYVMWDGSLQNGFEIATHPATLKSHLDKDTFNYETAFNELSKFSYRSHEAGTCGLHVHINRSFFGATKRTQNFNAGKMAYLLEKHWSDFIKFSRRDENQLSRWARGGKLYQEYQPIATAIDNAPITNQSKVKEKGLHLSSLLGKHYPNREKYVALNTQHTNTFEFRIFRGTLVYKTFAATLILIDNLARLVKESDIQHLTSLRFSDIINYRDSQILKDYWQTR